MINKSRTNEQKTPYSLVWGLECSNMVSRLWCCLKTEKLWSWFLVSNVLVW